MLLRVRVFGLRLTAGVGSLLVLAVVVAGVIPRLDDGDGRARGYGWILGEAVTFAALIAVLAIHEGVRAWGCRRLGVAVRRVDLFVFGGSAELVDATSSPRTETLAGIVGLAVLAIVGGVLVVADLVTREANRTVHVPLRALLIACAGLAVLQAMPALPLDGGRIVRAWVWYLTDDAMTGTRATAFYAQFIAIGLMLLGVILLALDRSLPFWGLWAAVAGWQLAGAARTTVRRSAWQRVSRAVTLDSAGIGGRRFSAETTIDGVVEHLIGAGLGVGFLVVDRDGRPVGALDLGHLRRTRRVDWDHRTVGEVMTPLAELPRVGADLSVFDAVGLMEERRQPLAVVERKGEPMAAVTLTQLVGRLTTRADVPAPRRGR